MTSRARARDACRELWREIRSDEPPALAPFPERGVDKPWKGDRLIEKAIGSWQSRRKRSGDRLLQRAESIAKAADAFRDLGTAAFAARCAGLRLRLVGTDLTGELVDECFALVREATRRELGMAHYPVQLMGGLVMLEGGVAEMATGEGKTITAALPAVTAALAGWPTHIFTVNDYLAQRDLQNLAPVYRRFGLSTGLIVEGLEPEDRQAAYLTDIVYGTNKEIAFDYLRDTAAAGRNRGAARRSVARMLGKAGRPLVMRGLHFALVDEADSIFIDEARTPLILSAEMPAEDDGLYAAALDLGTRLQEGAHFNIREADRTVELTEAGRETVADLTAGFPQRSWRIRRAREQLASQAISATRLFLRDRDYVVRDGKVQIVDESTGRTMADRSWEGGLHQLVETKEQVDLTGERSTLARITYQRFFRRYRRLAGMSGTVREVAGELRADLGIDVVSVPTHRPCRRVHKGHTMVAGQADKWQAVADAIAAVQERERQRPVLIGTRSVSDSQTLSRILEERGIAHRVLNALNDEDEAGLVSRAGEIGAVTVATNMAGRGTDIELSEDARRAGGLHVILTAFHETQRVDRQLYGRAGRQGDPGSSEAFSALDDELYRQFAPRAAMLLARTTEKWPVRDGAAEWLRKFAQKAAERHHARQRRHVELGEERNRKVLSFAGGAD